MINSDFLKLWIGQTVSELCSRITREGLPWVAIGILHASATDMGILSGMGAASVLLFGLMAGVWVDRLPRRKILIGTDLGRAALMLTVPLAAAGHWLSMPLLYGVSAIAGVLTVFFDVAYQSYLPQLVRPDQIVEGNTKLMLSATTAEVLGPGITGLLVQIISAPIAILIDAASFLFSAITIMLIRQRDRPKPIPESESESESDWKQSIAGLHLVASNPLLRALALRSIFAYFFGGLIMPLYMLFAIRDLHLAPIQLGVTIAMGGIGGMLGSLANGSVVARLGVGRTLIAASLLQPAALAMLPLAHGPATLAMAFLFVQQLFGDSTYSIFAINELSLRQTIVPGDMLGRVNAAMQLATRGVLPIGALVSGFLADAIGVRPVLTIAVIGLLLSTAWLFSPAVRTFKQHATG